MKPECSIRGCTSPASGRGWCRTHYLRWYRTGDPEVLLGRSSTVARYWSKVDQSAGDDGCWPWTGGCQGSRTSRPGHRYGIFWDGTYRAGSRGTTKAPVMVKAHRWAYDQFVGPIGGSQVLHRCDNPPCVNPAHLFLGTQQDNVTDMQRKGRAGVPPVCPPEKHARGCANGAARLTESQVQAIRAAWLDGGLSQQAIADRFGVGQGTVSGIVRRKTWTHVKAGA